MYFVKELKETVAAFYALQTFAHDVIKKMSNHADKKKEERPSLILILRRTTSSHLI